MKYCTHCGHQIQDDAVFCTDCGSPQGAQQQQQSQQAPPTPTYTGTAGVAPNGPATERNIALCIIFSLITCGIYGIYWLVCLNDELNALSAEPSPTSGLLVVLLSIVTCGIYSFYWHYKMGCAVDRIKHSDNTGILYLVLAIVGLSIVNFALMQDAVNNVAIGRR